MKLEHILLLQNQFVAFTKLCISAHGSKPKFKLFNCNFTLKKKNSKQKTFSIPWRKYFFSIHLPSIRQAITEKKRVFHFKWLLTVRCLTLKTLRCQCETTTQNFFSHAVCLPPLVSIYENKFFSFFFFFFHTNWRKWKLFLIYWSPVFFITVIRDDEIDEKRERKKNNKFLEKDNRFKLH